MTRLLDPTVDSRWENCFGKRYLTSSRFVSFCDAVGVRSCSEQELEEYERQGCLFPVARLLRPPEYTVAYRDAELAGESTFQVDEAHWPFHELDRSLRLPDLWRRDPHPRDLRHPIDAAWGTVPELIRPHQEVYLPWESYERDLTIGATNVRCTLAEHFYHHWQAHELYDVRWQSRHMYGEDSRPIRWSADQTASGSLGLAMGFEVVSRFQHLRERRVALAFEGEAADRDGRIFLSHQQQSQLQEFMRQDATEVCSDLGVTETAIYGFLRNLFALHHGYELSERVRLAKTLERDVWRTVELIEALTGHTTEEIAETAGRGPGFTSPYLVQLFPNRRKEVLDKCTRILKGLARREYNRRCPNYAAREADVEALVRFLESTDLSLLLYTVAEANDAFYATHSWRAAATYLALKSLASLPETLMRTIILGSGDTQLMNAYRVLPNPTLYPLACLLLQGREQSIWSKYETFNAYRSAADAVELSTKLTHLVSEAAAAQDDAEYLGATLALATLLRNFTSHHMLEDSALLEGHYLASVQSIVGTILLAWKVAQTQGWA